MADAAAAERLRHALRSAGSKTEVHQGREALEQSCALPTSDAVMAAIVGAAGCPPRSPRRAPARTCSSPTRKRW
jgi:1-deoxy-D-xylulose-5-phosphate reductoisomerase